MIDPPSGWRAVRLGQVCDRVEKVDPITTGRESIRYVDIGSIDGAEHRLIEVAELPAASAPTRARQVLAAGDTVFSTVRPYLEKIAYIDESLEGEFASTGFCVLRPNSEVLPRWLYHFASSRGLLDQVLPHQRGVSYPAVRDKDVLASVMPLAPIEQQRRIIDILEDHLSRLDAADSLVRLAQVRMVALYRAALRAEFGPASGELRPLTDVATIVNGSTPKGIAELAASTPSIGDVPFFKVGDMNTAQGALLTVARSYVTRREAESLRLRLAPPGTVVFPKRGGAIATNKKRILGVEGAFDLNTMGVRPSAAILPEYLFCWFEQIDLSSLSDGSNVPQINTPDIARLRIPVPTEDLQTATLCRLTEIREAIDCLPVHLLQARSSALRRSLSVAAFSGRLAGMTSAVDEIEEVVSV